MTDLHGVLEHHVGTGTAPGAVGLVARGERTEVAAVGSVDVEKSAPMARDSVFRLASVTKPLIAAAVMMLVDDGRITLDAPVDEWLPELASPSVVRTPDAPVDDVVPAARPITVADLLTFRAGWGLAPDITLPAVAKLWEDLQKDVLDPQKVPAPDAWLAALARIPLLRQPGEAYLYNTCSDIQGVLISRVTGRPLPEFLAERLFVPLGMHDTGFHVPADRIGRLTSAYQPGPAGGPELMDAPGGQWSSPPRFASGAGGLVSTADDLLAFARMLLARGSADGRSLLSPDSVRRMTTDHLTPAQRTESAVSLEGQGWGYGGSVDIAAVEPWNVPGRYGWVGGTGTALHIVPATGTVTVLLTQLAMTSPTPPELMRDFWRYAAGA